MKHFYFSNKICLLPLYAFLFLIFNVGFLKADNTSENVDFMLSAKCCKKHHKCPPQCPPGPTGPQGPQGIQGPTGPSCSLPFTASRIVYVNQAGDDITGDGSACAPYLTITKAMSEITDASSSKRYEINIGPGSYSEGTIHLKANVQLIGASNLLTRISSDVDINDPSWTGTVSDDYRSGFVNLILLGAMNFDFAAIGSYGGKLYFQSVNLNSSNVPSFTAASTSVNQVNIRDSQLPNGYTQTGINMFLFSSFVTGGTITINTQATTDAQVVLVGGGTAGNIVVNSNPGDIPLNPFNLLSFAIGGNFTVNNNNTQNIPIQATVDSIPITSKVTLTGNVTLTRLDDANGLAYTPNNPVNWVSPQPTTVQEALDRMASLLDALNSGPIP